MGEEGAWRDVRWEAQDTVVVGQKKALDTYRHIQSDGR